MFGYGGYQRKYSDNITLFKYKLVLWKTCHIVDRLNFAKTFLDKENCLWEQVIRGDKEDLTQ